MSVTYPRRALGRREERAGDGNEGAENKRRERVEMRGRQTVNFSFQVATILGQRLASPASCKNNTSCHYMFFVFHPGLESTTTANVQVAFKRFISI